MRSTDSIDDFGDGSAWRRRVNVIVVLGVIACASFIGTPHVRLNRSAERGNYVGIEGSRVLSANERGVVPLIVFVPLQKPLYAYAADLFMWTTGQANPPISNKPSGASPLN